MKSHSWKTVLHELLQCESFLGAAVLHKLLQHLSFLPGAAFQEQTAPEWICHGVTSPASKLALEWAPLSMGPLVHRSYQNPVPVQAPHGVTAFFGHPNLLRCGVLHGLQGDSLPHHSLHHQLQGNLYSGAWITSSPSFSTALRVCRVCTPLSCWKMPLRTLFFLLKYGITEELPPSLMGLALASGRSVLELVGTGFTGRRGSF